jgi:hypothetical protein
LHPTKPVTISVLFSGSCKIKDEREKSVREQRNRRTIFSIDNSNRKRRIGPMDIVPIFYEISSNKGKVIYEIREVFRFS